MSKAQEEEVEHGRKSAGNRQVTMDTILSKKTLIIIPAYNEEGSVARVIENIRRARSGCGHSGGE